MSVLDLVMQQLDGPTIQRMAGHLGATPQQTQNAISAALPLLIGAMQRNSASPDGAQALHRAVVRDHQNVDFGGLLGGLLGGGTTGGGGDALMGVLGSVLGGGGNQAPAAASGGGLMGVLGSVLGGGDAAPAAGGGGLGMGESILRHVLGGSQQRAAGGVARASGLDLGAVMKLLPMLAPLIMAALGRMTQRQQLDAGGLSGLLGQDLQRVGVAPAQGTERGFMGGMLDADGDGDVDASDLMARGSQLFGLFGR